MKEIVDARTYAGELFAAIQKQKGEAEESGDIAVLSDTVESIKFAIYQLKAFANEYQFKDETEEIDFFKHIKPMFLSEYIYFSKRMQFALHQSYKSSADQMKEFGNLKLKMQSFIKRNLQVYRYFLTGDDTLDSIYFVRGRSKGVSIEENEKFTTGYDKIFARFLANESIKKFIDKQNLCNTNQGNGRSILWTGSKVSLIELMYALYASKVFEHGKIDIKQIALCFESAFGVSLGNYSRKFNDIKLRKSGTTNFLQELSSDLDLFINNSSAH